MEVPPQNVAVPPWTTLLGESGGVRSDELNKPSDSPLSLTYLSVTWGSRVKQRCILRGGGTGRVPRTGAWLVEARQTSEGGRAAADPVYHHAEAYGNKAGERDSWRAWRRRNWTRLQQDLVRQASSNNNNMKTTQNYTNAPRFQGWKQHLNITDVGF